MTKDKNNFRCPSCDHEENIFSYITMNDKHLHKKSKIEICCPRCSTPMKWIKTLEGVCTTFGKYASSTPDQRRAMMKKRADDHFKKNLRDKNIDMDRRILYGGK